MRSSVDASDALNKLTIIEEQKIDRAVQKGLKSAARRIWVFCREYVPVDTGRLQRSIKFEEEEENAWVVSANTHYAAFVEFGTRKMAPRYYMARGTEAGLSGVETIFSAEIRSELYK